MPVQLQRAMAAEAAAVATQGNSEPEAEAAQGFAAVAEVAVLVLGKDVAAIDLDFVFDFHIAKRGFFGVGVGHVSPSRSPRPDGRSWTQCCHTAR